MKQRYVFRTKRRYILLGILTALFLFFLSQVIKLLPFDYLDFSDTQGVTIVDYGEQDKLYFADPMPTSYQIDRPTYSLQVHMGPFEVIPRVHITALNGTAILAGDSTKTDGCTGFSWDGNKKFHDELTFN